MKLPATGGGGSGGAAAGSTGSAGSGGAAAGATGAAGATAGAGGAAGAGGGTAGATAGAVGGAAGAADGTTGAARGAAGAGGGTAGVGGAANCTATTIYAAISFAANAQQAVAYGDVTNGPLPDEVDWDAALTNDAKLDIIGFSFAKGLAPFTEASRRRTRSADGVAVLDAGGQPRPSPSSCASIRCRAWPLTRQDDLAERGARLEQR